MESQRRQVLSMAMFTTLQQGVFRLPQAPGSGSQVHEFLILGELSTYAASGMLFLSFRGFDNKDSTNSECWRQHRSTTGGGAVGHSAAVAHFKFIEWGAGSPALVWAKSGTPAMQPASCRI